MEPVLIPFVNFSLYSSKYCICAETSSYTRLSSAAGLLPRGCFSSCLVIPLRGSNSWRGF